jgi:hypothetical protein
MEYGRITNGTFNAIPHAPAINFWNTPDFSNAPAHDAAFDHRIIFSLLFHQYGAGSVRV